MLLGVEESTLFVRLVTVLVPLGMYFLLLGLLNSRRTPQLLSGRQDFAMLVLAFAPLLLLPVGNLLGASATGMTLAGAVMLAGAVVLAPRPGRWVIYNLPAPEALELIRASLGEAGLEVRDREGGGFELSRPGPEVQISEFPLLRNVSVRLLGADKALQGRFARSLGRSLTTCRAETCPATVGLMLVAIAMMVAPLVLVAHRAGEIVRIVVDLLP